MTASSAHRSRVRLEAMTGTSVAASALITRYSRSTWCAEATSVPGGFLRSTKSRRLPSAISAETKNVGLEWPESN